MLYYSYGCYYNYYSSFYITAVNPLSTLFLFRFYHLFFELLYSFTSVFKVRWQLRDAGARLSSSLDWLVTLRTCGEVFLSFTFLKFFFSFQRLTQGPFRRFNSNKRFDFGYNSFDPHRVSFVTPHTLVHPHPAPLSQLPPSSFCHFIALSRPCSTGREKNQGKFGRKVKSQRELVGSNTGGVFVQDLVVL